MSTTKNGDRSFVHLHVHSHFSLCDGVASVGALVRQAAALGMPAMALTDHNSIAGLVTFLEACEAEGIQPLVGCELDVSLWPQAAGRHRAGSLVLLVESEIGYRNMTRLISLASSKGIDGLPPHVTHEELGERATGLIALVGASSPLVSFLDPPDTGRIEGYLTDLVRIFGKQNLFFEMRPAFSPEQRSLNDYFIQLGDFLGMGVVATNNVHYIWPEDELAWCFLADHSPPRRIDQKASELGEGTRHLASGREMRDRFAFVPQALTNTQLLAERCQFRPDLRRRRLLVHDFARGFDAESHLWDLVFRCATESYSELNEVVKSRLNEEFDYLSRRGLTNYFLLLWKVASFLHERRIPFHVRRGPITSSLIAYVLGLTDLDPLAYHVGFEPLVEEGAVFPEVTIQVASRHLAGVRQHLRDSYGPERVACVGRHQYWPRQVLLEEICRWAGLPKQKTDALIASKAVSITPGQPMRWADLFRNGTRSLPPQHPSTLSFVFNQLDPLPRSVIAQSDRLVLSGEAIDEVTPLVFPDSPEAVTQLDSADCDALGLPCLNLAASRSLDVLDEAVGWVRREKDRTFDLTAIDYVSSNTFRLFAQGRTVGVPGFEGVVVRSLLRRKRPANLKQLIEAKMIHDGAGSAISRATPPGTTIADCLLAYRCAYVKANYPVSYYTALLTHVCASRRRLARVLREMAQEGIRLLPPDINLSSYAFSQVGERIRTGLIVTTQMGEKAASEINSVRRGGAFHSLVDFCRRTDPRLVNHRLVENLIKAGAMDSFGLRRSQMLAILDRAVLQPRSQPVRAGATVQMELDLPALAAGDPEEEIEPPDLPELPLHLRLQYEMQAAGHPISGDLLRPFEDLLARCRVARAPVILSPRLEGRDLYAAGMVNQIERAGPADPEGPGAWLDFDGVLVAVSQALFAAQGRDLRSNEPLMIGGKVVRREDECFLRAHTIAPLIKMHQQASQARRVVLDLEHENKHTVRTLRQICGQFPGSTPVIPIHYESSGRFGMRKLESSRVTVCPPLLNSLRKVLETGRVQVVGYGES